MKIYLFDPETGIYQGEDFSDSPSMREERGALPPDATAIAPPPFGRGEVPVFSIADNRWEIRCLTTASAGGEFDPCPAQHSTGKPTGTADSAIRSPA